MRKNDWIYLFIIMILLVACSTQTTPVPVKPTHTPFGENFCRLNPDKCEEWPLWIRHIDCEPPPGREETWEMPAKCFVDPYSDPYAPDSSDSGCPRGCWEAKLGCNIKGNISIDSGEKIYHVPGQEYYAQTKISPEYGERWFCTEAEAIMNGWRKSYK